MKLFRAGGVALVLLAAAGEFGWAADEGRSALSVGTRAEKARQGRLSYALDQLANAREEGRAFAASGKPPRWVDATTGRVTTIVELRAGTTADDLVGVVAEVGGRIEGVAWDHVKLSLPADGLRTVAADPSVRRMRPPFYASTKVVSQGVKTIKADVFIANTGDDGAGVTVAVMDTATYGGARQLIGSELPADTAMTPFAMGGPFNDVHGTACAEIIHDVAPGAHLLLGGFDTDEVGWVQELELLVSSGADIISHSLGFDNIASPNGKNFFDREVDSIAARGVLFVTAAGNEEQKYNESTWSDKNHNNELEFNGKTERLPVFAASGDSIRLRWDDPFGGSSHDYDLYIYNGSGDLIAKSEGLQSGSEDPYEEADIPSGEGGEVMVEVRHDPSSPTKSNQKFFVYEAGQGIIAPAYQTKSSTLTLPADAKGALAVGPLELKGSSCLFEYLTAPTADNRTKPDVTAPDRVKTVSYGGSFAGTSAATPHAAGAAALLLSHTPGLSVSALRSALQKATASSGNSHNNQQGYGLLDLSKAH
jgi:subtilisin family serine protease